MKKHVFGRKFSRDYGSRQALFRALMRSLILTGGIKTTKTKAKAVQPDIDALVNLAKDTSIATRRQAYAMLQNDRETLDILIDRVVPVFANRTSGYTRVVPMIRRSGDNAEEARLEWVEKVEVVTQKKNAKKGKEAETVVAEKKGVAKLLSRVKKREEVI